ncbi:S-adenosyl-L-methionine-dependent methyltransferase [Amanita rubescens]|nr:S-adenosyl-L-methionine-dependent methyltransferase [Amanita rubescens]
MYIALFCLFLHGLLALKVIRGMNQSLAFTALGIFMGLSLLGLLRFATGSKDPYHLFHLTLNKRPGDQSKVPSTEWLNIGYWKDTDIFPDACRALALKLNQAAKRREGDSVLDVGHGTGESIMFMLTDPAVPRPSRIVGITSLPMHHQRTKDRVAILQNSRTQVDLYLVSDIPLAPPSDTLFDCVLALDCAYHFDTRRVFLSQALAKLVAGGKIALADMCFEPRYQWLIWLTAKLGIVPKENIVTIEEYALAMKKAGFIDIEIEDFTVCRPQWWLFSIIYGWYLSAMGVKFVLASGSRYGLVCALKGR